MIPGRREAAFSPFKLLFLGLSGPGWGDKMLLVGRDKENMLQSSRQNES